MAPPRLPANTELRRFPRVWFLLLVLFVVAFLAWRMFFRGGQQAAATPGASVVVSAQESVAPKGVDSTHWDERWQRWRQGLNTTGRDIELAVELEALVALDPARALASAMKEVDSARRLGLVQVILLLWAEIDPAASSVQARALPETERRVGVAAVLTGASQKAEVAVRLAMEFCRSDPSLASEHGYALIAALGRTGEYRAAVRFSVDAGSVVDGDDQNKWLKAAFAQWAEQNPTEALAAFQELRDEGPRFEALESIAANQVRTNPVGLAEALRNLPAGPDRSLVLGQALRSWVSSDPKTAGDWLNKLDSHPELDAGAVALARATQSQMKNQRPEVALSWAESIVGAELRSRTLTEVIQNWAASEPAAALQYVQSSPDLRSEDRATLLASLNRPTPAP